MGLGASGRAACELAVRLGADVTGVDLRTSAEPIPGVRLELGPHERTTFLEADLIVVSPGIPARQADLAAARAAGVETIGELGFAARFIEAPIVAITGTNGKSTVTSMTAHLLRSAGQRVFEGGNLGRPLCRAVLDDEPLDVAVVEVSSYQMELPGRFRPHVAAILNLTPDHLARHGTMASYAEHKARVFAEMGAGDLAVLPRDHALLETVAPLGRVPIARIGALPGVRLEGATVSIDIDGFGGQIDLSSLRLPGRHNRWNAAVACLLAVAAGADLSGVAAGIAGLEALPHRMQPVIEANGVLWIDDSKATNIDAARVGIEGLERTAVVLLGGQAKDGGGFEALKPSLTRHRGIVTFGYSGGEIAEALERAGMTVTRASTLDDAVRRARTMVRSGDAVLLSPACASFDAFSDFRHRGRVFQALARENP